MSSNTTNFNWILPTIAGDGEVWGDYINSNFVNQDELIRRFMNCFVDATPPTEAETGTLWLDSTSNPYELKIYGTSDWITIGTINTTSNNFDVSTVSAYIGDMKFSGQSASHGSWLLCDGSSISTTTYSGLFNVIGYDFGGSGVSFNLPDLRGRVAGAIGTGTGLTTRNLGDEIGEEEHTLTIDEMPAHDHAGNYLNFNTGAGSTGLIQGNNFNSSATNVVSQGGNSAHNIMQPTLFVGNYFIFSGV